MTPRLLLAAGFVLSTAIVPANAADFNTLDVDQSGGLSLSEVQAVAPNVTADDFAVYDVDNSGELSQTEFDAWKAASSGQ